MRETLDLEAGRCEAYMMRCTNSKLQHALLDELIVKHVDGLLGDDGGGFQANMDRAISTLHKHVHEKTYGIVSDISTYVVGDVVRREVSLYAHVLYVRRL